MNPKLLERIARKAGVPDILEALTERLPPTDLQSLLLEVHRRRAERTDPAALLRRCKEDRFVQPSQADPRQESRLDLLAFSLLPPGYRPMALSPVAPLGSCSAVAPVSQNRVLGTVRGTEVCADPTNALALECARSLEQRRREDRSPVRLCASHRTLRTQVFDGPASFPHFRLLCLCAAGRDTGSLSFETETLAEQASFHLRLLESLGRVGLETRALRLTLEIHGPRFLPAAEQVAKRLGDEHPDLRTELAAFEPRRAYYETARFQIYATCPRGDEYLLGDGGFTGWTRQLLADRKQRCLVSAMGTERLLLLFGREG